MYGNWLVPRDVFRDVISPSDAGSLRSLLLRYISSDRFEACIFVGPKEHWAPAIRYSVEGESGYLLWGDSRNGAEVEQALGGVNIKGLPFDSLSDRYFSSYFKEENRRAIPSLNRLLVGLIYATGVGVIGFGVVTDVNYDAFRNFYGWREDGRFWLTRFRIKVIYLEESVIENPERPEAWRGRDVEGVPNRANTCFSDAGVKDRIRGYIEGALASEDGVNRTLQFYMARQAPQAGPAPQAQWPYVELYLSDPSVADDLRVSLETSNVLLIGPPGVGKTQLAKNAARDGCSPEIYTANSLWFRRDVIGGETLAGGTVKWKSGILIRAYRKAAECLGRGRHYLIIDELNRADVDKAFGEFLTIFSSQSPDGWFIPQSLIDEVRHAKAAGGVDEDADWFLGNFAKYGSEPLRNMRVIATMNVMDIRNLFLVGQALMRRFTVIRIECPTKGQNENDMSGLDSFVGWLCQKRGCSGSVGEVVKSASENVVKAVYRALGNDRRAKADFCLSPASIVNALNMFAPSGNRDEDEKKFIRYLKYSMGYLNLNGEVVKEIDELIRR